MCAGPSRGSAEVQLWARPWGTRIRHPSSQGRSGARTQTLKESQSGPSPVQGCRTALGLRQPRTEAWRPRGCSGRWASSERWGEGDGEAGKGAEQRFAVKKLQGRTLDSPSVS